jgi:exonuclease VII large subunit
LSINDFNTPSAAALSIFENTLSSIQDLRTQQKATLENIKGLIKEKKEELNIRGASQYENEVHFFTCAAHKINNMALAMTDKSAKFLYT